LIFFCCASRAKPTASLAQSLCQKPCLPVRPFDVPLCFQWFSTARALGMVKADKEKGGIKTINETITRKEKL